MTEIEEWIEENNVERLHRALAHLLIEADYCCRHKLNQEVVNMIAEEKSIEKMQEFVLKYQHQTPQQHAHKLVMLGHLEWSKDGLQYWVRKVGDHPVLQLGDDAECVSIFKRLHRLYHWRLDTWDAS